MNSYTTGDEKPVSLRPLIDHEFYYAPAKRRHGGQESRRQSGYKTLEGGVRTMAVLPRLIRPMLATLRRSLPADQDRYGWEVKWDGVRAVAYVSAGEVRLVSRNDKDMAPSYPELAVLAGRVGAP